MKSRTRYLFIGLGFLVFGIISPLIVFYVSGFSYDWETDSLTSTGLLSIKTEPSKAEIFLNGENKGTSPASVRFLEAREYEVSIRKEGYFDWNKKLEIKSGKVTWASDRLPELHLIKKDPAPVIVFSEVVDFFPGNDFVLYLTETELIKTDLAETAITDSVKLDQKCQNIIASPTQNLIMLVCDNKRQVFNQVDLTKIDLNLADLHNYTFGPEDSLYHIESGVLYKTNTENGQKEKISENVSAFAFQGNSLYQLKAGSATQTLVYSPLYNPAQTQTLIDSIPVFKNSQLFISRPKEAFVLGDGTLYRINENLETLLSGIKEISFDADAPALTYTTGNELYAYDFSKASGDLIMRQGGSIKQPQGKSDIGYVLYISENNIHAAEADSRDQTNNYLIGSGDTIKKYTTDPSHSWVYFLDGSTLKFFRLR